MSDLKRSALVLFSVRLENSILLIHHLLYLKSKEFFELSNLVLTLRFELVPHSSTDGCLYSEVPHSDCINVPKLVIKDASFLVVVNG